LDKATDLVYARKDGVGRAVTVLRQAQQPSFFWSQLV